MLHPKLTGVPDTPGRAQLVAFLVRGMLSAHKGINLLWGRMNSLCFKLWGCDRWVRRSPLLFFLALEVCWASRASHRADGVGDNPFGAPLGRGLWASEGIFQLRSFLGWKKLWDLARRATKTPSFQGEEQGAQHPLPCVRRGGHVFPARLLLCLLDLEGWGRAVRRGSGRWELRGGRSP